MTLALLANIGSPFVPEWADLRPFAADLWLIVTIVATLLTPFFVRRPNVPCAVVSMLGLGTALVSLLATDPAGPVGRFAPMLVADGVAHFWKAILLLFVIGVVLLWFNVSAADTRQGDGPEFFTLLLGATLGMSLMASAANLLMLFMAIELASLPSYVLAGFRKGRRLGAEASLKYVLFGAACSAVMVYGLSLLYGLCGTLRLYSLTSPDGVHLPGVAEIIASGVSPAPGLLAVALTGVVVGAGFKIAAVPLHFWCPDVFEGAAIDVTAFLSVASKGAGLILLLRVAMALAEAHGFSPTPTMSALAGVVGLLGAATATVGNTAAFTQTNLKRLLAYSSIAHAGYMLCAVSLLTLTPRASAGGFDAARAAAQAILVYLAVYLFMNLGAFVVVGMVWRRTGSEDLSAFRALGRRSPLLAASMTLFLVSLIGLPPVAGFTAKINLLWALIQNGGWAWWLVAAIVINTVVSAFYYFRVVRAMYLEPSDEPELRPQPVGLAMTVVCAIMLVAMFLGFGPLANLATKYSGLYESSTPPTTRPTAVAAGP